MNWTLDELDKVKQEINEKARVDKEFRLLCLDNPRKAVEQISGNVVPEGFNIRFVENEGAHMTHVLPDYIAPTDEELSEKELEQVSAARISGGLPGKPYVYSCSKCGSQNIELLKIGDFFSPYKCRDCGYYGSSLAD